MSDKIVSFDEAAIKRRLESLVKEAVQDTLNALLDEEAGRLVGAERYERSLDREAYRSGHYKRNLTTKVGDITLDVPKLKGLTFQTAIIERYKRRETSVEEALIEMYLAGVSTRRIEDVSEVLWGTKVSSSTVSNLNQKAYEKIERWRSRPLSGHYPYVYVDGLYLKRSWGGEYENIAILIAIGVNSDGHREIIGCSEGLTESKDSWKEFFRWLKERGLSSIGCVIGDKHTGMLGALEEVFSDARYQRCVVHFYRNVFSKVPPKKRALVAKMLKAIHAQESKDSAIVKAGHIISQLKEMRLDSAARVVEDGYLETLAYMAYPLSHWNRIKTNNALERLNREIRRRTRVVGTFPDGLSALMLVTARCKYVAESSWGKRRYLDVSVLEEMEVIDIAS
jgi:transposase-like protein